jgi:hypothetical protein
MSGYAVSRKPYVPASEAQRIGKTQVLDMLYYDTLLYGAEQDLQAENQLFTSTTRIRNDNLCNLKDIGKFADGKQFAVYCFGAQFWHASDASIYEQIVYHSRVHVKYRDSEKQIIWLDQAGAGGGLYGMNNSASAFVLSNGEPTRGNCWLFSKPLIIVPGATFELTHKFMSGRVSGATVTTTDPLTAVNADTGDRTLRFYIRGLEGRNVENG